MIPIETLVELCGYAFEPWGNSSWYSSAPATEASIARISHELGVSIPPEFILLSQNCRVYGGWFASIGEDYDGPVHILRLNQIFHETDEEYEALPSHLVLLNHGHDGDCDCWDTSCVSEQGEHPIIYFDLDSPERHLQDYRFATFREYLEHLCRVHAPRTSNRNHRRKAKRILSSVDGDTKPYKQN